jgi:hypothetical protein
MKKVTCLLLLFISLTCFSQTAKELENELHVIRGSETMSSKKDLAFKLLAMDTFNAEAVRYLSLAYQIDNQKDSLVILLDRLVKENPKRPEPYMLQARFLGVTSAQKIDYLKKAYKIDSLYANVNYELGKLYYDLFINEFAENKNKENLATYSRNSIKYFSNLCDIDLNYREALRYPLLQLATYLGDDGLKTRFEQFNEQAAYFPLSAFVYLPTDWKTNYSVNVMSNSLKKVGDLLSQEYLVKGVESARSTINWYSGDLRAFNEPVLNKVQSENVYRLTWLRSFHNPIVVGLEKTNHAVTVYWKERDKSGKIINDKSRMLTQKEWTDVVASIQAINFWNMPSLKLNNAGALDGAQWILEGKASGSYHVVDRWTGGNDIQQLCMSLVKLTDLAIKSGEIY